MPPCHPAPPLRCSAAAGDTPSISPSLPHPSPHTSSVLPIPSDCMRACCFSVLRIAPPPSAAAAALLSVQFEFVAAEVVAAWPQLPAASRIELLPSVVQVRWPRHHVTPSACARPLRRLARRSQHVPTPAPPPAHDVDIFTPVFMLALSRHHINLTLPAAAPTPQAPPPSSYCCDVLR